MAGLATCAQWVAGHLQHHGLGECWAKQAVGPATGNSEIYGKWDDDDH